MTENRTYTAADLVKMLRDEYPQYTNGGYNVNVVLEQVPDGTGYEQSRWIDVVIFKMWRMHGLTRSAYEIKVSRQDFVHELQHPEKHQWCKDSFHEFWFVAPKEILKEEELPSGAGWMYPQGDKLVIGRHAPHNDNPVLNDILLAAFMRSAAKASDQLDAETFYARRDGDFGFKQAKMYEEAALKFLRERKEHVPYPDTSDAVYNELVSATLDKTLQEDRDNFLSLLDEFQDDIIRLTELYLVLANKSLTLRDEYGQLVAQRYGGHDEAALDVLKKLAKIQEKSRRKSTVNRIKIKESLLSLKHEDDNFDITQVINSNKQNKPIVGEGKTLPFTNIPVDGDLK